MAIEIQNTRLAALIIADDATATPLVLGKSLTELQVSRVVSAGARHVVCLVRQVSSQMLIAADNLRANGLSIDIVRTVAEAADAIHPEEAVFLVASTVLVSVQTLGDLSSRGSPALLCVENDVGPAQFEIIDAATRWTGYALLDGATLRGVAAMVGDWDAASTLLRHLVQEGAPRVVLGHEQLADAIIAVRTSAEAVNAGRKLLSEDGDPYRGLGGYWLGRPTSRFLARLAGELGLRPKPIKIASVVAAVFAAIIGLAGWLVTALALLLLTLLIHGAAVRLIAALGEMDPNERVSRLALRGAIIIIVGAVAITLTSRTGQWGYLVLGGLLLGSHVLLFQRRNTAIPSQKWMADPLGGIAILLAGFVTAFPVAGLLIATGHAMATYLRWQHQPHT